LATNFYDGFTHGRAMFGMDEGLGFITRTVLVEWLSLKGSLENIFYLVPSSLSHGWSGRNVGDIY